MTLLQALLSYRRGQPRFMHGVGAGSRSRSRRSAAGFGAEDLSRIAADSGALVDVDAEQRSP